MADSLGDKLEVVRDDGETVKVSRRMWDATLQYQEGWSLKAKRGRPKKAAADDDEGSED